MTRDYSKFFAQSDSLTPKATNISPLQALGWGPFFATQTDIDEMAHTPPARITEVHRSGLRAIGENIDCHIPAGLEATVGDWVLYDQDLPSNSRVLERKSLIKRRAPGSDRQVQLIAANIDTAFIVSSCNQDFNIARLERYIALVLEAEVSPVILLTKSDLCDDAQPYIDATKELSDLAPTIVLDARGDEPREKLADWCKPGATLAFLGSSGVGKSTLTNALAQNDLITTQAMRADDAKGRHTTTSRHLHFHAGGYSVLDTPGMRELQLTDAAAGLADVFADFQDLTTACKFNDCQHQTEPGCAVTAALEAGDIDPTRLARWRKLVAEEKFNTSTLAERRTRDKAFGKMIKKVKKKNRK